MARSLAIAYQMKKKKKASGGTVKSGDSTMNYAEGGEVTEEEKKKKDEIHNKRMEALKHKPMMQHLKDKVNGKESLIAKDFEEEEEASGYAKGGEAKKESLARRMGFRVYDLNDPEDRKAYHAKQGPNNFSDGGFIEDNEQDSSHEMDMISRAMKKRRGEAHGGEIKGEQCPHCGSHYSKGGEVANDTGQGESSDKLPNEFDDLVLRADDMEVDDTSANSGDQIGNEFDSNHDDTVARAMMKRKKRA